MLRVTGGARLFVSDTGNLSPVWVEVADIENLGALEVSWSTVDVTHMRSRVQEHIKGMKGARAMQIVMGHNLEDPGQTLLFRACESKSSYAFRLQFPNTGDGSPPQRFWQGLVMSIGEVFDTANSVMKLMVEIQPVTPITSEPSE